MSRDQRGYNGLRPIGSGIPQGVPLIGQGQNRPISIEQAIEHEINSLARSLFLQVAPALLQADGADYVDLGARCKDAAAGFMLGVGIITLKEDQSEPDSPAAE